jgi:hypothetical protein
MNLRFGDSPGALSPAMFCAWARASAARHISLLGQPRRLSVAFSNLNAAVSHPIGKAGITDADSLELLIEHQAVIHPGHPMRGSRRRDQRRRAARFRKTTLYIVLIAVGRLRAGSLRARSPCRLNDGFQIRIFWLEMKNLLRS